MLTLAWCDVVLEVGAGRGLPRGPLLLVRGDHLVPDAALQVVHHRLQHDDHHPHSTRSPSDHDSTAQWFIAMAGVCADLEVPDVVVPVGELRLHGGPVGLQRLHQHALLLQLDALAVCRSDSHMIGTSDPKGIPVLHSV